jgi:hypothetical protein
MTMILSTTHYLRLFIGLGLLLLAGVSHAQSVQDLYEAKVLIENADEGSLNSDLQRALMQIIIKLSGNHHVLETKPALKEITDASRYVERYQYDTLGDNDYLIANFSSGSLSSLLQHYGLKIWSSSRPDFLAWLLVEAEGKQEILNADMQQETIDHLKQHAQQRGLPVLLPMMDLEDRQALKISDIVEGNQAAIRQATERYGASAILVGQLTKTFDNQWLGKWRVLLDSQEKTWEASSDSLIHLLTLGTDEAIDFIATKGTRITVVEAPEEDTDSPDETTPPPEDAENTLELQIVNVLSLNDYSQVTDYLHKLDVITQLQLKDMSEGRVTFKISVQGGKTALINALNLGNLLTPSHEDANNLVYQFIPN